MGVGEGERGWEEGREKWDGRRGGGNGMGGGEGERGWEEGRGEGEREKGGGKGMGGGEGGNEEKWERRGRGTCIIVYLQPHTFR